MKKFINVPIGGTTVLSIELEEGIAKGVAAKTGNCVMFCKNHWYVSLLAYLSYRNMPPMCCNEYLKWDRGDCNEEYRAICLTYRELTYDDMRKLKLIFGEDGFYFHGGYSGCGEIEVMCKIEYQKD